MNKTKPILLSIWYFLNILFHGIFKEVIFRVISIVLFPIAYILRWKIREHIYGLDKNLVEERILTDTQNFGVAAFYQTVNKCYFFLWMFLDGSSHKDRLVAVRDTYNVSETWDSSDTRRYYPAQWVFDNRVLRDIWFSFIRNNSVNYVSWYRTAGWNLSKPIETFIGIYDKTVDKNDNNSKYAPGYYIILIEHNNGKKYPYFTYVGEIFGRKVGIWMGRSSGLGRFSFSIRA